MAITRRLLWAGMLALAIAAPSHAAAPQPLVVLAAASLQESLTAVADGYAAAGHVRPILSFASSAALARQIENGAPADLFVSADAAWMDYLADKALLSPGQRRDLLTNRLALIAPVDSKVRLAVVRNMPLAAALKGGRLAMAAPEVPAGRYGRAALTSLGVWPSVADRLATGESVRTAMLYVSRGEAPLGVVYDTDARVDPKVRIVGLFPRESHPPIVYPAAVLARSGNADARGFLAYLQGPQARAVFRRYGFATLP